MKIPIKSTEQCERLKEDGYFRVISFGEPKNYTKLSEAKMYYESLVGEKAIIDLYGILEYTCPPNERIEKKFEVYASEKKEFSSYSQAKKYYNNLKEDSKELWDVTSIFPKLIESQLTAYHFTIKNESEETQPCVLFGWELFKDFENLGSGNGVSIQVEKRQYLRFRQKNKIEQVPYEELIQQADFETSLIRVINSKSGELKEIRYYIEDVFNIIHLDDYFQVHSIEGVTDFIYKVQIKKDRKQYLKFNVPRKQTIQITLFPETVKYPSKKLYNYLDSFNPVREKPE
jgi:hypothetical protein